MVGVAVYVTDAPAHMVVPVLAEILTLTGKIGFTVIVKVFDIAGEPVTHVRLLVIWHVIKSPLTNVLDVYVEFVSPTIFDPFFFH